MKRDRSSEQVVRDRNNTSRDSSSKVSKADKSWDLSREMAKLRGKIDSQKTPQGFGSSASKGSIPARL